MPSVAMFYLLPASSRGRLQEARAAAKRAAAGGTPVPIDAINAQVETIAITKEPLGCAGLHIVDYLFSFVHLPERLHAEIFEAAIDNHHYLITANLAFRLQSLLEANPPEPEALLKFAESNGVADPQEYATCLQLAHDVLRTSLRQVNGSDVAVLGIPF